MDIIEIIRTRRSIRKFTGESITEEKIKLLKEIILRSPSSRNRNPWKFYFVENSSLLKELSKAKTSGSSLINDAKLAVVVGANPNISDVWVEDCSIAAIFLQLAAQSIGLCSCWVQIRNRKSEDGSSESFIRKLLNIEEDINICSVIAIGYPAEIRAPLEFDKLDFTKIIDL